MSDHTGETSNNSQPKHDEGSTPQLDNGTNHTEDGPKTTDSEKVEEEPQAAEEFMLHIKTCGPEQSTTISLQVAMSDNVQDLKQYLSESITTSYITNYDLYLNDTKVSEVADLRDVPGMGSEAVLEMRESLYDERSIRFHVRRLCDIMTMPDEIQANPTIFTILDQEEVEEAAPAPTNGTSGKKTKKQATLPKPPPVQEDLSVFGETEPKLSNFFPPFRKEIISPLIKDMRVSSWNPPPSQRKLKGDLFYFEVTTLEGRVVQITGWTKGFYVNSTTSNGFNPTPSTVSHSTIVGLLSEISPLFRKNLQALYHVDLERSPLELHPLNFEIYPWLKVPGQHKPDTNRAEDFFPSVLTCDPDIRSTGQLRDWNDEYQNCKEMPSETLTEKITRDRSIFRTNADFVAAARRGAVAILNRTIAPINPGDEERGQMFIYNNIFFSHCNDSREFYTEYGGDGAAHIFTNNDLKGLRMLNQADVKGLHTLLTAVIDYRGYRLTGQSIIPGILQREQTSTVVYGSIDNGKKVSSDPEFHRMMTEAGKVLHLQPHSILLDGEEIPLCAAVESKGIIGTDGRHYLLDLFRMTPRDPNYTGKYSMATLLRPELIERYSDYVVVSRQKDAPAPESEEAAEAAAARRMEEVAAIKFNPNIMCNHKVAGTAEELAQQEALVNDAASFLRKVVIPHYVSEAAVLLNTPIDGQALTTAMHIRGINMRYLGLIAATSQSGCPLLHDLAVREMILRTAKVIFREVLKETKDHELGEVVAHLLNCLLAHHKPQADPTTTTEPVKKKKNKGKGRKDEAPKAKTTLTAASLWERILVDISTKFNFTLAKDRTFFNALLGCHASFRAICYMLGFQMNAVDYNFDCATPFKAEDVVDIYPLVKHVNPENQDSKAMIEAARQLLGQGRKEIAFEILNEAMAMVNAVYGPLHRDMAECYAQLAMIHLQGKDLPQALECQQRAIIIYEKMLGAEHHDTILAYVNLSNYYQIAGRDRVALAFLRRALYINRLLYHAINPSTANLLSMIGMTLHEEGRSAASIPYLKEATKVYEELLGPGHAHVANMYHSIAVSYSNTENFQEALNYEKRTYNIFKSLALPADDNRVVECNMHLKEFTARAVQKRQVEYSHAQLLLNASQQRLNQQMRKAMNNVTIPSAPPRVGARSINEVLAFINGSSERPSEAANNAQRSRTKKKATRKPGTAASQ